MQFVEKKADETITRNGLILRKHYSISHLQIKMKLKSILFNELCITNTAQLY